MLTVMMQDSIMEIDKNTLIETLQRTNQVNRWNLDNRLIEAIVQATAKVDTNALARSIAASIDKYRR